MKERLDRIYREEADGLLAFIKRRISDPEEAEDILHEIFARAAEAPSVLGPIENLLGWLYTSARNKIIDVYRKRSREPKRSLPPENESLEDLLGDSGLAAEEEFLRSLTEEFLEDAIAELPDEQRTVFLRQAVEGLSFRELAEESGISINTLMARKRYAVLFLRKRLAALKEIIDDGGYV